MTKLKKVLASTLILLSLIYFFLMFFYYYNFYLINTKNIIQLSIFYFIPSIFSLLSLIFLFTKTDTKINYLTFVISLFIFFFSINLYLTLRLDAKTEEKLQIANSKGIDFDTRTRSEIIKDYRKNNKELYPAVYSNINYSHNLFIDDKQLHTLGGISNVVSVTSNEGGEYQIYKSDRYGFNNPNEVHDNDKLQIGIVGDSFMQGNCVKREHTLGGVISEKFPKTLTIASAGNGSLSNLASLIEYLSDKEPEVVLWFFYAGNDLIEQNSEREQFSTLRKYLEEKNFKQNLNLYQKEIDEHLIAITEKESPNNLKSKIREIVLFFALKPLLSELTTITFKIIKKISPNVSSNVNNQIIQVDPQYEREYLIKVLLRAREIVEKWSGTFITVYIPYQTEMFLTQTPDHFLITNKIFYELMEKNNINNIDIVSKLKKEKDIKGLYALDMPSGKYGSNHFDEDGYKKISEIVLEELKSKYNF